MVSSSTIEVNDGYWLEVFRALTEEHHLSQSRAKQAITNYQAALERDDIGELIYHSPIESTVQGILVGGFLPTSSDEPAVQQDGATSASHPS